MEYLHWNDETMSIGIELIDEQHKELLKIINQLSTTIHENSQKIDIIMIKSLL
jgi:hemerythrin